MISWHFTYKPSARAQTIRVLDTYFMPEILEINIPMVCMREIAVLNDIPLPNHPPTCSYVWTKTAFRKAYTPKYVANDAKAQNMVSITLFDRERKVKRGRNREDSGRGGFCILNI